MKSKRKTKKRKILITGGAGFIGSNLAEKLLEMDQEVYIIDDLSTGSFENISHLEKNKSFHYVIDSILNKNSLGKFVDMCDHIYHLAAAVGVKTIIDHPMRSLQINLQGTENVLEAANKKNKKVFIASTSEVYGKNNNKNSFTETDDRLLGSTHISRWGYASSKSIDEFMSFSFYREKNLPIVIGRLFNIIGKQQTGEYGMVVPTLIKQALRNRPMTVFGTGKQSRCFCYVSDAVDAIIRLMNNSKAVGELFNVGSDEETTIDNLAKKIKLLTKSKSPIEHITYKKAYENGFEDMMRRKPNLSKIRKYCGWYPRTSLDDTLKVIIRHLRNES